MKSPTDGNSIVTTIDANLQAIVEKHILELNERLRDNYREGEGTKNTAVILMDQTLELFWLRQVAGTV
ncbi:hypothetical protein [Sellimonas intestinalis]|uniref:hypothetical protein n=1 Tax=Sellimonas intestinalis TaxID=1653434 RepID=UPI00399A3219